jgi:hypothetical protein
MMMNIIGGRTGGIECGKEPVEALKLSALATLSLSDQKI